MKQRSFGNGVDLSVLGIGCGRVGSLSNLVPMREIEATLEAAADAGINLFDTADIYGQGDSERTLGRLKARHRGRIFVITKIGYTPGLYTDAIRIAKPLLRVLLRARPQGRSAVLQARSRVINQDFSVRHLRQAADASRRRLGVDRLDGLLLHNPPLESLRSSVVVDFLCGLLQDGIASHVGVSVSALEEVEAALAIPAITMLQVPMEVARVLVETAVPERIRQRNIGLFVREVLRNYEKERHDTDALRRTLAAAITLDSVAAAIVGVSTRRHLDGLLAVVS